MHIPNNTALKYMGIKLIETQREIGKFTKYSWSHQYPSFSFIDPVSKKSLRIQVTLTTPPISWIQQQWNIHSSQDHMKHSPS